MSTATRNSASQALKKPMVCGKCKAPHFSYALTCKRCGEYLNKLDMVSEGGLPVGKITAFIGIVVALVGVCFVLHLF